MGKVFMKINIGQCLYTVILTSPMVANHVDIPERENVTPRKRGSNIYVAVLCTVSKHGNTFGIMEHTSSCSIGSAFGRKMRLQALPVSTG